MIAIDSFNRKYSIMLKIIAKTIKSHLSQNKVYTLINILGLAIAIGCSLVIYKIVTYETSFDSYQTNYENIYRLIIEYQDPVEGTKYQEGQVPPVGNAIREEFPGVDAVMTFYVAKGEISQISVENENGDINRFQESQGLAYADPNIFKVFDFDFIAGNPSQAINNKGTAVIASSLAQKYIGLAEDEVSNAMNKFIKLNNIKTIQVTGIISDPPQNTDFPFTIIANYKDNPMYGDGTDWNAGHSATNCYLLLQDNISPVTLENQLVAFYDKYLKERKTLDQRYVLQPLSEVHSGLCNNYSNRQMPIRNLIILGVIGLFLILIASFNFINLSVVQATKRFKEIGIKKIFGQNGIQSVIQILIESVFIAFIAAIAGLFIAYYLFIFLEGIIGYRLNLDLLSDPSVLVFLFLLAITIGLLSGLYPALIIGRMNSKVALKNTLSIRTATVPISVRRTLIIIQFVITLVLIMGTLVMAQQLNYFLDQDLGFDNEAVIVVPLPESTKEKLPLLKEKLLKYPEIDFVSFATRSPLADWRINNPINYPTIEEDIYWANLKAADEDYMDLYNLEIIAGQNFSKVVNSGDVVVNRKLTTLLGFDDPNDAIGAAFEYGNFGFHLDIVGVVEDFYTRSLHKSMENVIFGNFSFAVMEMAIKVNPDVLSINGENEILQKIQKEWDIVFPEEILNYTFLDQKIDSLYREETNTSKLIRLFAIIAILIGNLGLYGLISYISSQKTKEIGIRKVNGAKVSEILLLLNKDFLIYFSIAFVVATPLAYYLMDKWLQQFAYRTELSWWIFALAGGIALLIALLTVSGQTFAAARKNPAEAFRYE